LLPASNETYLTSNFRARSEGQTVITLVYRNISAILVIVLRSFNSFATINWVAIMLMLITTKHFTDGDGVKNKRIKEIKLHLELEVMRYL